MRSCFIILLLIAFSSYGQDQLILNSERSILGHSVAKGMSYFVDESAKLTPRDFLDQKSDLKRVEMKSNSENIDFTHSSYFIHFSLENQSGSDQFLVLETARPFTNKVVLFCLETNEILCSGDEIPFELKNLPTNFSALKLVVPSGESREYVLQLNSRGENMSIPLVFYDAGAYEEIDANRKLSIGIFIGIFIFVIIIYLAFLVMLREKLFLIYVLYAATSGLLQFAVDGYMHQYIFQSGGYFTQHCVIFIAGSVVVFGMLYALRYLVLKGFWKKLGDIIVLLVVIVMIVSLIPNVRFELSYRLINGLSLVGLIFMIISGFVHVGKRGVSKLFLVGLSFLVLGGFVFILGNLGVINNLLLTQNALKIGTLLEMISLAILMVGRYKVLQEEREEAQKELLIQLEDANVKLEVQVAERTKEIEKQRIQLKEKNEDFMASVTYAERIQSAVLSNEEKFHNLLPDSFVFFQPKDVVSGDFYWIDDLSPTNAEGGLIGYVTADCTGHGVPGALVSIIGNHLLESAKISNGLLNPGKALDALSVGMNAALNSKYVSEQIRDGMDLTLCLLDRGKRLLHFAGARNSAYIVRNGELIEIKGDRKSIGFNPHEESHTFQSHTVQLEIGDMIYTCSDGYVDQFGGEKGKKFMAKRLKSLFVELSELPLMEQKNRLVQTLDAWKGELEQLDDVLVIGVRITN